jgi:CheY-like chemotaxis protein
MASRVHVVHDGAEALDFLFCKGAYAGRDPRDMPRVVLVDLKLPKIDGLEVVRQVKANPKTRFVPMVILSSSREQRDIVDCYEAGANSYIVKPMEFDLFEEAIRQMGAYWTQLSQPPQP